VTAHSAQGGKSENQLNKEVQRLWAFPACVSMEALHPYTDAFLSDAITPLCSQDASFNPRPQRPAKTPQQSISITQRNPRLAADFKLHAEIAVLPAANRAAEKLLSLAGINHSHPAPEIRFHFTPPSMMTNLYVAHRKAGRFAAI
jgi:hypothetical protein